VKHMLSDGEHVLQELYMSRKDRPEDCTPGTWHSV